MKVAFLSSSLEPGRDGVGDYVCRLANHLASAGVGVLAMGINDRWINTTDYQVADSAEVSFVRLPAISSLSERFTRVHTFLQHWQPDWISLQYVAHGLEPKGLPWRWNTHFARLQRQSALRHLMFHELWMGEEPDEPFRHQLLGVLQRAIFRSLLKTFAPHVLHTSNPYYQTILRRCGAVADILPIFGSIPLVIPSQDNGRLVLSNNQLPASFFDRDECWLGLFFGTLHHEWQAEPLLPLLLRHAMQRRKRLMIATIGRMGKSGTSVWSQMVETYRDQVTFVEVGEQSPAVVSQWLQAADFGIAASPPLLIGKSSAAAAMVDHGLPVIVSRTDWAAPLAELDSRFIYLVDPEFERKLETKLVRGSQVDGVAQVASMLLESWTKADGGRRL